MTCINTSMSDKELEEFIGEVVMNLMLEAYEQGKKLTYSDVCKMVGVPEEMMDSIDDSDAFFTINEDFVKALECKETRSAMIQRAFATVH